MPDGTFKSTEEDTPIPALVAAENTIPTLAAPDVGVQDRVLELADTCFEVFSLKELRNQDSILPELVACYPDVPIESLRKALVIALEWKRQLARALRHVQ